MVSFDDETAKTFNGIFDEYFGGFSASGNSSFPAFENYLTSNPVGGLSMWNSTSVANPVANSNPYTMWQQGDMTLNSGFASGNNSMIPLLIAVTLIGIVFIVNKWKI
jgi:hypothetical protein